jgi:cellulose synthase/poly-beta-1,6-N-acetylglucosamine synthase-like glycosyltransferase
LLQISASIARLPILAIVAWKNRSTPSAGSARLKRSCFYRFLDFRISSCYATWMIAPDLSIVIVSYNVREYLRECLNSVPAACGELSVEVFVTDNASRDESAALVEREFPNVHLTVNSENLGMARAVNQMLPQVRGRYILLLNPDAVIPKDALARLVAVADRWPEVGVAGPSERPLAIPTN